jgi:ABC-2 type transport system permease protein
MATTSTQSTSPTLPPGYTQTARAKGRISIAFTAFMAILRRDILVTGREFIAFLLQVLLQPLFFLFIFGKVLPGIGFTGPGFAAILLPGIVALTVVLTALQGVTLPLVLDLGFAREIDDRLLAPLPVNLVAVEKVIFAAMRGLIAGAIIFPLAYWILGNEYQVRTDAIGTIIGIMVPSLNGHSLPTLAMGWVILGLSVTFIVFLFLGIRTFRRRVVM